MRRLLRVGALAAAVWGGLAPHALAQNLFEVQVFPDETLGRGETSVELHDVLMPSGTLLPDQMLDPSAHLHLSVEVSHGWTERFEMGVFIETSPSTGDRHAAFTGFHLRPKYRFEQWASLPFHVSLSAEYAFMKQPGDAAFRQALAITPIFERHIRAFEMSFNPAVDIGIVGPDAGSAVFEPSAKIASRLSGLVWLGAEYYAETGPIQHFEPLSQQHHLLFSALDFRTSSGWDVNVGVGRGLTGSSEHWVVKWIVGLRLPR